MISAMVFLFLVGCAAPKETKVSSPDGEITIEFNVEKGIPFYSVSKNGKTVISKSKLGFEFAKANSIQDKLEIVESQTSSKTKHGKLLGDRTKRL